MHTPRSSEASHSLAALLAQPLSLGSSWIGIPRSLPREKGHASASACLGSYCNLEQCTSFVRGFLLLPCDLQELTDSVLRTPSAGNAGEFFLSLWADIKVRGVKNPWIYDSISLLLGLRGFLNFFFFRM